MSLKKKEDGLVIVEAAIVFPVMFLVIFIMLSLGNAYWQLSRLEAIVTRGAIEGAAYCADPLLYEVVESGTIPSVSNANVYPYRYFDPNGINDVCDKLDSKVKKQIESINTGVFSGMTPQSVKVDSKFNNGFIYSTYSVEASCKVRLPYRFLGVSEYFYINLASKADMPVSDSPEFIRNVEMVEDYMENLGIMDKIDELKAKLGEKIEAAKKWFKK